MANSGTPDTDVTDVREVWAVRWSDGSVSAGQYSKDGSDHAEQMVRMLAGDGEVVHRTVTITRTPWETAPDVVTPPGHPTQPPPPEEAIVTGPDERGVR